MILTHGHEDHVGGLPYLIREVGVPEVWATRLTLGLIKSKLDEHGLIRAAELREIEPAKGIVQVGPFRAEFIRVTHSIPDAVAVVLHTAEGTIVHTGDIKIDHTPIDGRRTELHRFGAVGEAGVALLLGDSTNAERDGTTPSEAVVAESLKRIVRDAPGPRDRDVVRVAHPPPAGGHRRRRGLRAAGLRGRPLDDEEPQHRAQPRLRERAGRRAA